MDVDTVAKAVEECQISDICGDSEEDTAPETILGLDYRQQIQKWPKLRPSKIPVIFLHKPANFENHIQKILGMKIRFYQPTLSRNFTKISCVTYNDHRALTKYFEKKQLPYHTFGNPAKRKMKVVLRGLPKDIELEKVKKELKSLSIPVVRVHEMKTKNNEFSNLLLLVVVPYDRSGLRLISLQKLLGYEVVAEPPKNKPIQCYRCQKWGHTERYCHGMVKCVKCAGDHSYKKCSRNNETKDLPKCANCGGDHTANYKKCSHSPFSVGFEISQIHKQLLAALVPHNKPVIVTQDNCHALYKKVGDDEE